MVVGRCKILFVGNKSRYLLILVKSSTNTSGRYQEHKTLVVGAKYFPRYLPYQKLVTEG